MRRQCRYAATIARVAATAAAMLAGVVAGLVTATSHLTLRLNTLLCGILVLTMLFSIDIRIMGKPNMALFAHATIFDNLLGARDGRYENNRESSRRWLMVGRVIQRRPLAVTGGGDNIPVHIMGILPPVGYERGRQMRRL
jgi:hypothetical protein